MAQPFPTTRSPRQRLLVFARVPELGLVKTRLAATLGEAPALRLYQAMLGDLLAGIGPSDGRTTVELLWSGSAEVSGEQLRAAFPEQALARQSGETAGDRLAMAFSERFFFEKTQKIVAIGTDAPTLDRQAIDSAFALLDSCEWVLGPAEDGGYYLIGARAQTFSPEVFLDMPWRTPEVFDVTVERFRAWGHTVATLPRRRNVDVEDDLRTIAPGPRVRDVMRQLAIAFDVPE